MMMQVRGSSRPVKKRSKVLLVMVEQAAKLYEGSRKGFDAGEAATWSRRKRIPQQKRVIKPAVKFL